MSLTAYLSPTLLQQLTDVSVTPSAGNTGYPLVWNNSTSRFELAVLGLAGGGTGQVTQQAAINALAGATTSGQYLRGNGTNISMSAIQAADVPTLNQNTTGTASNVTGTVAVANGGWGSSTGSFTSPGAITLAAGGTNQNITLQPSGTASVKLIGNAFEINQSTGNTAGSGLFLTKGAGFFSAVNGTSGLSDFWPIFFGTTTIINPGLAFVAWQGLGQDNSSGVIWFSARSQSGASTIATTHNAFVFSNYVTPLLSLKGNGNSTFHSTTESTSTTTGALTVAGGAGIAGNLNLGGNLRFAGGTVPATATSAGTAGDIRYDGGYLYICTATNTWVRTALSTW